MYSDMRAPVRNCAVTAIAPTGTISMIAECSSGIEPRFAPYFKKDVMTEGGIEYWDRELIDFLKTRYALPESDARVIIKAGWKELKHRFDIPAIFQYAHDVEPQWHVATVSAWQKYVDNGISKTINLQGAATREDVEGAFYQAWEHGCKGVTVYREGSHDSAVLSTASGSEYTPSPSASRDLNRHLYHRRAVDGSKPSTT